MKKMIISDLHYEKRIFRGVDESRAWEWLLGLVDYHKPDLLLSCGDWGAAINVNEFYELLKKVTVLTIYGNHENMEVLAKLYNVRTSKYLPILMEDGKVYEISNLRIAGINGIIAKKRKTKKGVPRKTPEEFLKVAEKLKGKDIDILLLHETPFIPELFPFMAKDFRSLSALEAIKIIKPRLVINGHMHSGCYKTYTFPWGTKYIYISSDQKERCYLLLNTKNSKIEVWRDLKLVDSIVFPDFVVLSLC